MPPSKTTVGDIESVLRTSNEPVLSAELIAELLGVTSRTIRNRTDELKKRDSVGSKVIGGTHVFWHLEKPGPDEQNSKDKIANSIRETDKRAITAPEIAEAAGLTNKTVYKHLDSVARENDDIQNEEIGGSTAYWASEDQRDGQ